MKYIGGALACFIALGLDGMLIGLQPAFGFDVQSVKAAKQEMIRQSINDYYGNCPCPYNLMRNGRKCGGRSAYSRPNGESPLCYESDISNEQALRFLKKRKN